MLTPDDLRAIPLFSDVPDASLEYLVMTSADIRVLQGEYVLHEGETRPALFVLIAGRMEVTKIVDGVERLVGTRAPGESFGELPVVLNASFAVSFRAATPARVMRIEAKDFHAVAAASPKFSAAVTATALDRVEGLQDIAAEPSRPALAVIGPQWDNATHVLRDFLQRNSVEFDWIRGDNDYPMVRLQDETLLMHPSIRDVARAIGLSVSPQRNSYDVAVVGAGPAGLAAAVYSASEGLSTLLVEREAPGGQAGTSSRIENYLGFPFGVSGDELANRALQQARRLGAEIVVTRTVESIDPASHALLLDGGETVNAKAIVLAPGVSWRKLSVPSLERLQGCGVYYGAAPGEARYVHGAHVYLVGGGNSAGQAAINLANFAESVTLVIRGGSLSANMSSYLIEQLNSKSNILIETESQVVDAFGEDHLVEIAVSNGQTGETRRRNASALFIMIGADAETGWLPSAIERDAANYVITGPDVRTSGHWLLERPPFFLETSVPGIFAAGDVRSGSVKRVAAGVGEGSMAIAFVHQYLASNP